MRILFILFLSIHLFQTLDHLWGKNPQFAYPVNSNYIINILYISEYLYTVWGSSRQKTLIQQLLFAEIGCLIKNPGAAMRMQLSGSKAGDKSSMFFRVVILTALCKGFTLFTHQQ